MTENTENTFSAYLGPEFQQRLIWQLLVEPEFAEKIIPDLAIEYFDDPNLRRLFVIILEYFKEYEKVPNLQNRSIHQAINEYKTPNNVIEEESLFAVIKRITLWNERIINKQMLWDGDVVQKSATFFIKQQEYRKLAEHTQSKVKDGGIRSKHIVAEIEERFQKIALIGDDEDDAKSVGDGLRNALRPEFRQTIPTGIETIDVLTDGGLGKGEIGVVLTPSGVGKTTFLTKIANNAFEQEKNVAQIIFEDTKEQIQRKHSVIWADSALSRIKDDLDEIERVYQISNEKCKYLEGKGRLIIKRFSQEDTTMRDIRNWMVSYEKKWGFKFDILVLDYLDCVESHKRGQERTEAELTVIKGFETLAADFEIPAWTAIQSNRSGFDAEFVEAQQSGGSIKRIQKAHFFMSVAKTPAQKEAHFANIRIIKARFAQDGQTFEDCTFNNDTMKIIIDDDRYRYSKTYKNLKHHDAEDIDKLEKKAEGLSKVMVAVGNREADAVEKVNSETINGQLDPQTINDMLRQNKQPEQPPEIKPNTEFEAGREEKLLEMKASSMEKPEEVPKAVIETEILELDGEVTDAPSDGVSDAVNDGIKPDLLDFTGNTETIGTTIVEPISNIPVPEPHLGLVTTTPLAETPLPKQEYSPPAGENVGEFDDDDILNMIDKTDTDAPEGKDKEFQNMLVKKRDYQNVKPKEKK